MRKMSGFKIMLRLITELKPLVIFMLVTITMGVLGYLSAIAIPSLGAFALADFLNNKNLSLFNKIIKLMILCGVLRGAFRYIEQLSGHYIAFKILAILRDKLFSALRKLAPAKLEIKEKGNLISLITSDVELLEVFYAHTIAPIAIALITNTIITVGLFKINYLFGILAIGFYLIIGFFIPYFSSKFAKESASEYRKIFGESNSYFLDSLRGLKETLLFKNSSVRLNKIEEDSKTLNEKLEIVKKHESLIRMLTDLTITLSILSFLFVGYNLYISNSITFGGMIVAIVVIASSFGPVVALSNLSNNLLQTFASAERVFSILDEKPLVDEIPGKEEIKNSNTVYNKVDFSYPESNREVFSNMSIKINKGDKVAIVGESGVGKSTFCKLLMRFWDVDKGSISIGNKNLKNIPTKSLRAKQVLVSQETYLFNDTIVENIKLANKDATREDVIEACKKASLDKFIKTLPNGYDTNVGELGGNLSSGEKQRIGLARAFLSKGDMLILDEPTSNLDTLNEGLILKAIKENSMDKTILLITHRKSTTSICNKVLKVKDKKLAESENMFEDKRLINF